MLDLYIGNAILFNHAFSVHTTKGFMVTSESLEHEIHSTLGLQSIKEINVRYSTVTISRQAGRQAGRHKTVLKETEADEE
jgi:hypothetical protein